LLLDASYTSAPTSRCRGGRRGHDPHLGRALRRLWLLPAQGQAGVPLDLLDLERINGPARGAVARQAPVEFDFSYDGKGAGTTAYNSYSGLGQSGTGTLKVDGKVVDSKVMEKTLPMILQWDESFDVGSDTLTGVNDEDCRPSPSPPSSTS
jgi:arylsulfatase